MVAQLPRPAEQPTAQDKLAASVARASVSLHATGDRTVEDIENSDVTLTLGPLGDSAGYSVVCNHGGQGLSDFAKSVAANLSLSGTVSRVACGGGGKPSDPFTLQFHLHFEGGSTGLRSTTLVTMPISLDKEDEMTLEEPSSGRETVPPGEEAEPSPEPVMLNEVKEQTSHAELALPANWKPEALPKPIYADSPFASFECTYQFADGKLTLDQKLVIKVDTVEIADLKAFAKWREDSGVDGLVGRVDLQGPMYYPSSAFLNDTEDKEKAGKAMSQAWDAIWAKQFTAADSFLHEAEAAQPDRELLHHYKGMLAAARGEKDHALAEYEAELQKFPDAKVEMEAIARAQVAVGEKDAAADTLQRWMTSSPDDFYPAVDLIGLYSQMQRDDLAARAGDEAMNILSKDAQRSVDFLLAYGRAQMRAGQVEAARHTLESLLDFTEDVQLVNDAAYFLSEQGLDLDRSEQLVRTSLAQFDGAGNEGLLSHRFAQTPEQFTDLLFSTWDTLGWILFREGKISEAEEYLQAAWLNKQDPAIAFHVGSLLEKKEQRVAALNIYTLGLAAASPAAMAAANDPDLKALQAAITRLQANSVVSTIKDPKKALAAMRVLDVGPGLRKHAAEEAVLYISSTSIAASTEHPKEGRMVEEFKQAKLPPSMFPKGSEARMTRAATVLCDATCIVTLHP